MKVVIIGNGKVGGNLASTLAEEGHSITVVDIKSDALKRIENTQDVMTIEGNGATIDIQREAAG